MKILKGNVCMASDPAMITSSKNAIKTARYNILSDTIPRFVSFSDFTSLVINSNNFIAAPPVDTIIDIKTAVIFVICIDLSVTEEMGMPALVPPIMNMVIILIARTIDASRNLNNVDSWTAKNDSMSITIK